MAAQVKDDDVDRARQLLALQAKAIYSGIGANAPVIAWFWHQVTHTTDAVRAQLHRALFGDMFNTTTIRELRIMSAGATAADDQRLITCNSVVHVLLLPNYSSCEVFLIRFDESVLASFKQRVARVPSHSHMNNNVVGNTSPVNVSAVARRLSTTHPSPTNIATASTSLVKQNAAKFEHSTAINSAVARRPLTLQERLEIDQKTRAATPPAPQPTAPRPIGGPTSSRVRAIADSVFCNPPAFRAPPGARPLHVGMLQARGALPATAGGVGRLYMPASDAPRKTVSSDERRPTSTVSSQLSEKPKTLTAAMAATAAVPAVSTPTKTPEIPAALPSPSPPSIEAPPITPTPVPAADADASESPPVSPTSTAASARPPVPNSRPPLPRKLRDSPLAETTIPAQTFSDAFAKPPKPTTVSPRRDQVVAGVDTKDEVAAQRAAQAEAQRLDSDRLTARAQKLASLPTSHKPIYELVVTEEDYCRWLDITHLCFVDPLRRHRILTDDELTALFFNIAALKETSSSLVRAFKAAGDEVYLRVGEIFVETFDARAQEAMYESVAAQEIASAELQQLLTSNDAFAEHCRRARLEPDTALTDVASLQVKPFQRLTKYPLLFRAILAETLTTDADFAARQKAAAIAARTLERVDELRETRERREKAIQLQQRIAGASTSSDASTSTSVANADADSLRNARVLLHEGEVTMLDETSGDREMHMFLFSDCIMFAKTTSKFQRKVMGDKSFRMHDELPLTSSVIVAESRRPGLLHAFDICVVDADMADSRSKRRGPRKVTLVCSTHMEVAAWLFALESAIKAAKPAGASDDDHDAAVDGTHQPGSSKRRVKKRRQSSSGKGSSGEVQPSVGRLERQLLAALKARDSLEKLVKRDGSGAAEAADELSQCEADIAKIRARLEVAKHEAAK